MSELEKEILEIINCEIEGCYIGKLKVKEDRYYKNYDCKNPCQRTLLNINHTLELYLNTDYEPIAMSYMSTRMYNYKKWKDEPEIGWEPPTQFYNRAAKAFKEFITTEFKNRMLQQVDYYKINLELPSLDCNEQTKRDR